MTEAELKDHFKKYGMLRDAYIPKPFRAFAFITYDTGDEAEKALNDKHVLKGERCTKCSNIVLPISQGI